MVPPNTLQTLACLRLFEVLQLRSSALSDGWCRRELAMKPGGGCCLARRVCRSNPGRCYFFDLRRNTVLAEAPLYANDDLAKNRLSKGRYPSNEAAGRPATSAVLMLHLIYDSGFDLVSQATNIGQLHATWQACFFPSWPTTADLRCSTTDETGTVTTEHSFISNPGCRRKKNTLLMMSIAKRR